MTYRELREQLKTYEKRLKEANEMVTRYNENGHLHKVDQWLQICDMYVEQIEQTRDQLAALGHHGY